MKRVIILRGVSGSGKSTFASREFPEARVVSADNYFMQGGEYEFDPSKLPEAHQQCWRNFWTHVTNGIEVIVVDNTNTTVDQVSPYVLPAQVMGYEVTIITIEIDPRVAHARNTHSVPAEVVTHQHKLLQRHSSLIPPYWRHERRTP